MTTNTAFRGLTESEWNAEGIALFGDDRLEWRFVCPSCGHAAAVKDWKAAGAPVEAAGFSCVGRWSLDVGKADEKTFHNAGGPCAYAGGGLIGMNPVALTFPDGKCIDVFEFDRPGVLPPKKLRVRKL
jgi:hypothetical protein